MKTSHKQEVTKILTVRIYGSAVHLWCSAALVSLWYEVQPGSMEGEEEGKIITKNLVNIYHISTKLRNLFPLHDHQRPLSLFLTECQIVDLATSSKSRPAVTCSIKLNMW